MESVEAEGDSIDAAIETALDMLGVSRDRAEVEILSSASRGLFGIGARKARVRATLRRPLGSEETPGGELQPTRAQRQPIDERARGRACDVLREIVSHLGVRAEVELKPEGDEVLLDLRGDSSGLLIGRRGQMLDALEYVVNRIVARDEGAPARIVLDSQGYRRRRREALEELARRMGQEAKKRRRPVTLNAMSPRDRRIVHMILQEDPSLNTRSSGKGYFRKLVIIPEISGRSASGDT